MIFGDAGLDFIDVQHHTSDFEKRILSLQWAIDQVLLLHIFIFVTLDR